MQNYKPSIWLLIALLLIGITLRIGRIGFNSLWFDEVFSRNVAVGSDALTIAREGVAGDVHPPLYFIALHGWVRLAGDSAVSMRMLSALTMILTLPTYYHLGRLLFNRRIGLFTLILAVFSPLQIYYGHEARQYAMSMFFVAWMLVGLAMGLRGGRRGWWLYGAALLGGLYTHYFTALVLVAIQVWLLVDSQGRRQLRANWRWWVTANGVAAVLFVPQLFVFIPQAQAVLSNFWIAKPSPAAPLATLAFLIYAITLPRALELVAMLVLACLLAIAVIDMRRAPKRVFHTWLMCLFIVLLPLIMALIISLTRSSIYLDRSFSMLDSLLLAAIGAGIYYAKKPSPLRIIAALLGLLMLAGLYNHITNSDITKPPYREMAGLLDDSGMVLHLHDSSYLPIDYYAPSMRDRMQLVNLEERSWLLPRTWEIFGIERISRADLATMLGAYTGPLQVIAPIQIDDAERDMLQRLRERACAESISDYTIVALFKFEIGTC